MDLNTSIIPKYSPFLMQKSKFYAPKIINLFPYLNINIKVECPHKYIHSLLNVPSS